MRKLLFIISLLFLLSCRQKAPDKSNADQVNELAEKYVRLGLAIGQYDADFVDAYYGPDSLKPIAPKKDVFPKDSFLNATADLITKFNEVAASATNDTLRNRAEWINAQLIAFKRRIKIFSGEYSSFDEESKELFGVVAPTHPEEYYKGLVQKLDTLLPGKGTISMRFQQLANRFIIPKNKLDTVFKTAIAESRRRTMEHYKLPQNESFVLEYVTGKPWSGYNWYKGNSKSVIQINTDVDIFIDRAIDVASHESYPGHHVYNMLLEQNLYRDKGWMEISLYPLYAPQSLIAEGSANYGIEVAFPGDEKNKFIKNVLLPLAGLDTAGCDLYLDILSVKSQLSYARNEAARGLINGTFTEAEAVRWIKEYGLANDETALKNISFIKAMRSYIINYSYGLDLVKNYIDAKGGTADAPAKRWEIFGSLLSNEVTPAELMVVRN